MSTSTTHQINALEKITFLYQCYSTHTQRAGFTIAAFNQKYPEGIHSMEWERYPLQITPTELSHQRLLAGVPTYATTEILNQFILTSCDALCTMNRSHPRYSAMMQSRIYRDTYMTLSYQDQNLPLFRLFEVIHSLSPSLCHFTRPSGTFIFDIIDYNIFKIRTDYYLLCLYIIKRSLL